MKTLKKFAALTFGLMLTICFCAFTACGGGKATAYTFLIKNADGTNLEAGYVQLCIVEEDGDLGSCLNLAKVSKGKVVYNKDWQGNKIAIDKPGVYEVHVLSDNNGFPGSALETKETYRTSADKFGTYTIYLK